MNKSDTDWFRWAEITESDRDRLLADAKKFSVPIFDSDSEQEIFSRVLAKKIYKSNMHTIYINVCLTIISFLSAVTVMFDVFGK